MTPELKKLHRLTNGYRLWTLSRHQPMLVTNKMVTYVAARLANVYMFRSSFKLAQSSSIGTSSSSRDIYPSVVIDKNIPLCPRSRSPEYYHVHVFRVILARSGGKAVEDTSPSSDRCIRDQASCFVRAVTVASRNRPSLQEHNPPGAGQERSGSLSRC